MLILYFGIHVYKSSDDISPAAMIYQVCDMDKKQTQNVSHSAFVFGGTDENRTRVQKPLDITFSVGSQSFRLPFRKRRLTGFCLGSPLMHDRFKGETSIHVHY